MRKRMKTILTLLVGFSFLSFKDLNAQIDESQLGAWYMYFWNTEINDGPWGFQGDIQHRNWDLIGDLEQLLLRGGVTYKPKNSPIKFTLGYGNIQTGAFGDLDTKVSESRIYQEALIPQKVGSRFYLTHRFRYEQRFVENQDFRTRFRYNLFLNIILNKPEMQDKAVYLAFYNELFINGERDIGDGNSVQTFDRNRFYSAIGYAIKKNMRVQFGSMRQITNTWGKTQMQLSFHHSW